MADGLPPHRLEGRALYDDHHLARLATITDELRVLCQWEQGGVLVYGDLVAQYGRQGWEAEQGDRLLLASMFDDKELPGAYGNAYWARIGHSMMC